MKLSVIIPAYNEAQTIATVIGQVRACGLPDIEIIVVNDCSSDGTREILEAMPPSADLKILHHDQNQGKGAAIRSAQKMVTGDAVIIQDADLEYAPTEFPVMIRPLMENKADAVFGSRYSGREILVDTFWHYFGNKVLTAISNICSNLHLTDMETCYKMIRADLFTSFTLECNRFGFEPEITAKLARRRARIYEVPIAYQARCYDDGKKIGWRDGVAAIWYIIKYNLLSRD